jgi:hypothetical protein
MLLLISALFTIVLITFLRFASRTADRRGDAV